MKMNKVLPVVALLVSVHASAWHPTLPSVTIPNFAKSVPEKIAAAIKAGQNLCSSGLNHVQNARSTKFIANHPKTAVAATGALAAYVAFAILGKNCKTAAVNAVDQGIALTNILPTPVVPEATADEASQPK